MSLGGRAGMPATARRRGRSQGQTEGEWGLTNRAVARLFRLGSVSRLMEAEARASDANSGEQRNSGGLQAAKLSLGQSHVIIPKLLQSVIGINELINTYYRPSNNR